MKITAFIHAEWDKYNKQWDYILHSSDMSKYYAKVTEVEIEFETINDAQLRKLTYDILMKERQEILATAHVDAEKKLEQAQEMLALPNPESPKHPNKWDEEPF